MCASEEKQPVGKKRYATPGKFKLDLHGMIVRAVEHGHLMERDALLVKFEHTLRDKGRLLGLVESATSAGFR
jgi:hypothetical protein